jgi:hypothetical protein
VVEHAIHAHGFMAAVEEQVSTSGAAARARGGGHALGGAVEVVTAPIYAPIYNCTCT